jgi:hypothetical protein
MQGPDPTTPACVDPAGRAGDALLLAQGIGGLRIAIAGGLFPENVFAEGVEAVARVAKALGATSTVEIPEAARARAAAYVITCTEGARCISIGCATARRFRSGGARPAAGGRDDAGAAGRPRAEIPPLVSRPGAGSCSSRSTPSWRRRRRCTAPKLGQVNFVLDGVELPVRANIGITPSRFPSSGCRWSRCRCRSSRCRSACRSLRALARRYCVAHSPPPRRFTIVRRRREKSAARCRPG